MTTLVTGATGLVGNNVVRLLLERGERVRVLVRAASAARPLEDLAVELAQGDVRDERAVRAAVEGVSRVVHSAAQVQIGWTGLASQREINVEGTRHVAAATRDVGAKLVHVSSVDALGIGAEDKPADEETPAVGKVPCSYVISKKEAETAVMEHVARGLHATIVNPGFMLGPWDWKPSSGRMLLEVAKRFTPIAPRGGCSVCDVRDVAGGILAALDQGLPGRRYILAGHNIRYLELWKLFARVTGSRPPFGRGGPLLLLAAGACGDLTTKLTSREPDINSAAVRMGNQFHYYSSVRAEQELGYRNRPLEATVSDAWQWFQTHGYTQ